MISTEKKQQNLDYPISETLIHVPFYEVFIGMPLSNINQN